MMPFDKAESPHDTSAFVQLSKDERYDTPSEKRRWLGQNLAKGVGEHAGLAGWGDSGRPALSGMSWEMDGSVDCMGLVKLVGILLATPQVDWLFSLGYWRQKRAC
jgi:hypothetical protein